jgi:hypothetical protein
MTEAYWTMLGEEFREDWSDAFERMGLSDEEKDAYVAKYVSKLKKYQQDSLLEKKKWWKRS